MVMFVAESDVEKQQARDMGIRIRNLRNENRWSQELLAMRSDNDRSWISLIERGGVPGPDVFKIYRLARALGVTVENLITGMDLTEVSFATEPEKVPILRRMSRYALQSLTKGEGLMAHLFDLEDSPGEESQPEGDDEADSDGPNTTPDSER